MNLLFDLDGTLTDSRPGIIACIKHALRTMGESSPTDDELLRFIGPPLRDTFAQLLRANLDAECVTTAIDAYRARFVASGMFENSVYERIPAVLDELAVRGARLFVATSKPRVFAERILDHFGLAARFEAIYGSELDGSLCEKGELIAHALARSALRANETVMIGDRHHDIVGALRNEVLPAGVLWGYGSENELRDAGAKALLAVPEDALQLVPAVLQKSHRGGAI
jgi:phosphoglycolate phosphatase